MKRLFRLSVRQWGLLVVCIIGPLLTALLFPEWTYRLSKPVRDFVRPVTNALLGRKTVQQRLEQYGDSARRRFRGNFREAGVDYPPNKLRFVGIKETRQLHVYARAEHKKWKHIDTYRVRAASGSLGPKLREGDRQVPEGVYEVTALNPNSSYHLSLKVGYPNERDRRWARRDGRSELGGNIFIHGDAVSIGCLAMGDRSIEELFVMAANTGLEHVDIIIAPVDFRTSTLPDRLTDELPKWSRDKYELVRSRLSSLPVPSN